MKRNPASTVRSEIGWIALDAVGTLIHAHPPAPDAYHRIAVRHGSQLSCEQISIRFQRALSETPWIVDGSVNRDGRTNESVERERWRTIVRTVVDDVAEPDACFEDLFEYFARPNAWQCFPEVEDALRELADRNYRLVVASNFDSRLEGLCDRIPELTFIERRIISSQVGFRKPSQGFFAAVIRKLRVEPRRILMVGDDWTNDVAGPRSCGIPAIHLERRTEVTSADQISTLKELPGLLRQGPVPFSSRTVNNAN